MLRSRDSEQLWSIPRSEPTVEYSEPHRYAWPRFWIAAPRSSIRTSENVFESLPARERPCSAFFQNSKNLASCSCRLGSGNTVEHGKGVRQYPQRSSIPTPRFNQVLGTLNRLYHTGGTYSQNGVMDYPRYPISELHLVKFPNSLEFQSWKVNFNT